MTCKCPLSMNSIGDAFAAELLERDTTPVYSFAAKELIRGKVILVTGGGGSIGSEIVAQLIRLEAKKVYCLDNDEFSLYNLSLRLYGNALLTEDNLILADIGDKQSLSRLFARIRPDYVFHAAAHKHLPLLERFPLEAVKANVFGTDNVVSLCVECGVKTFVNISTDKVAEVTSVLGMSKLLAEFCTAGYGGGTTRTASVRFGNVLGSRGSFLPTMIWQIEHGLPVTVTHREATRYFMTIPEAAALVIEAAVLAVGGETYVLDMGEPIKIVDIIGRYAKIAGRPLPRINFTCLRPGEKLREVLFDSTEAHLPTAHPRITRVDVRSLLSGNFREMLDAWSRTLAEGSSAEIKQGLRELIQGIRRRSEIPKESAGALPGREPGTKT